MPDLNASQTLAPSWRTAAFSVSLALSATQTGAASPQVALLSVPARLTVARAMAPVGQVATLSAPATLSAAQVLAAPAQVASLSAPARLSVVRQDAPQSQVAALSAQATLTAAHRMSAPATSAMVEVFTAVPDRAAVIRLAAGGHLPLGAQWPDGGRRGLLVCTLDASAYAGSATVVSAAVSADPAGLTVGAPTWSGRTVSVRVTGGKAGVRYLLSFSVGLSDGRSVSVDTLLYRA